MYPALTLNVDELWLKGKNRKDYFRALQKHVRRVIKVHHNEEFEFKNVQQRLVATSDVPFSLELVQRLQKVPGLNAVTPTISVELDLEKAYEVLLEKLKDKTEFKTFKVRSKRINKRFQIGSQELNRKFATAILKNTHLKVDVHNPDIMLDVKIMNDSILMSWERFPAVCGLPVGTSGHGVTLISGGFDSPVASFNMAKRGVKQTFAFFYAYPYVGEEVKEKIVDICKVLSQYQFNCDLYIIPFGDFQNHISKECKEDYRTLLFRYYMMKVSSKLADKVGAEALIMGDALGQVSSQTMTNMAVLDRASEKLVIRPLIGLNKMEIIRQAKEVGTHDVSVLPHDDACALFAPKHPVTRANSKYFNEFIQEFPCDELVEQVITDAEKISFNLRGKAYEN